MPDREIISNLPDTQLPQNSIKTNKYSVITFLPKNLLEQFSKMSNVYFLVIGFMQLIPDISFSGGQPVIWMPLSLIVFVSMVKDLMEDFVRYRSDMEENNKKTILITPQGEKIIKWADVQVGNILKVNENDFFAADMLVLKAKDQKNQCFIETKNLDGETNLKHKVGPKGLLDASLQEDSDFSRLRVKFNYEKPNPFLYEFKGRISPKEDAPPVILDNNNFVLRGCSLKNTEFVIGLVAYTGHDTKIMLNSISAKSKSSSLEKSMNQQIIFVFLFQLFLCFICACFFMGFFIYNISGMEYLRLSREYLKSSPYIYFKAFSFRFGSWLLLFTYPSLIFTQLSIFWLKLATLFRYLFW